MRRILCVVALVVVLAGCGAPMATGDSDTSEDGLGTVDGISYDDDISITVEDGLNETELDLLATRSMARIEIIRGHEFEDRPAIDILTREEYREWRGDRAENPIRTQWENQVWEATFIVGQDRDVTAVFEETLSEAVGGFYSPAEERIVIVTDDEDTSISKHTLVHELVHALQDQQFGLEASPPRQDPSLARNGVIEGEAELIPERYFERCDVEWECIEPPASAGSSGADIDPGIILVIIQPYQQGPGFIEAIYERDGWESVDDLYDAYPESTAQIIEPERYPDDRPVNVSVEDRSSEDWERLDHNPVAETVGPVGMYAMFWHNGIISVDDVFSYRHPAVDGWAGDELVPYSNAVNETGYVWESEWESPADAEQFHDAYLYLLAEHGALERGQQQFVISEGPFEGAFDVQMDGTTVRTISGPSIEALDEIHE